MEVISTQNSNNLVIKDYIQSFSISYGYEENFFDCFGPHYRSQVNQMGSSILFGYQFLKSTHVIVF